MPKSTTVTAANDNLSADQSIRILFPLIDLLALQAVTELSRRMPVNDNDPKGDPEEVQS